MVFEEGNGGKSIGDPGLFQINFLLMADYQTEGEQSATPVPASSTLLSPSNIAHDSKPWTLNTNLTTATSSTTQDSSPNNDMSSFSHLMNEAIAILADTNSSTSLASKISFLRDQRQMNESQILEALIRSNNKSISQQSTSSYGQSSINSTVSPPFYGNNHQPHSHMNASPYRQSWLYSDEFMPPRWASWTSLLISGATLFHGWQARDQWIPKMLQVYHDTRNTVLELFGFNVLREEETALEEELIKVHVSLRDQVKALRQEVAELKAQVNMLLVQNFEQTITTSRHEKLANSNAVSNSPAAWATPVTTDSASSGLAFYRSMREEAESALRREYTRGTLPNIPDNDDEDNLFSYYGGGTYDHNDEENPINDDKENNNIKEEENQITLEHHSSEGKTHNHMPSNEQDSLRLIDHFQ